MLEEAKKDTMGERNYCMILMCYYHGMRVSELLKMKISDIDFNDNTVFIPRLKNGFSTIHPLQPKESEALKRWLTIRSSFHVDNDYVFVSARKNTLSRKLFYHVMKTLGERAGISVNVHPHMLRHSCGFSLADEGKDTRLIQDYLGHRNIRHTVLYTASNAGRFSSIKFE